MSNKMTPEELLARNAKRKEMLIHITGHIAGGRASFVRHAQSIDTGSVVDAAMAIVNALEKKFLEIDQGK